jgi:non-lysosomal glucosylceramidase
VKKALASIYRYNFRSSFYDHPNTQRIYALNDEKGLVLCSWPKGGRPKLPFVYSDEVWTGIEFQVAAHLIFQGLVEEGLAIVKGITERYDGLRRNPWNEVECGSHYARALASWSVLMALSGYRYSAIDQSLSFSPVINVEDFRCFFAAGPAWGVYSQKMQPSSQAVRLEVSYGNLPLRYLKVNSRLGDGKISVVNLRGPNNQPINGHKVNVIGDEVQLDLGQTILIARGTVLAFQLSRA